MTFGRELLAAVLAGSAPGGSADGRAGGWAGAQVEAGPLRHVADLDARTAACVDWPAWAHPPLVDALVAAGVERPWSHQARAADLAWNGRHVVVGTGTASGKSLAYQLPVLSAMAADPHARALYLAPTKALGHDQLRAAHALCAAVGGGLSDVAPTSFDGDTHPDVRRLAREQSRWLFSNPDMVHLTVLRRHARWAPFLRRLRYVVVDECHHYRGVFGSNVALVLRRLLRLAARHGGSPTVVLASATTAAAADAASRLLGEAVTEVTEDGSPHGPRTVALWEPALRTDLTGEHGAPVRRAAGTDAARMMADLVAEGARTLTFVRSRRGAETVAVAAEHRLAEVAPHFRGRVRSYRAGYLAEDRRELERSLSDGSLLGLATTNALELGVDIAGLDAVVMAGYPGTVASFWQQAGRSGRRGQGSLVVLVARDDPLDTYLVHHPEALLGRPVEMTVIDPANPRVLEPQLLCAAAELPLTDAEVRAWDASGAAAKLVDDGLLRRRPARGGGDLFYPAPGLDPHDAVDIRGGTGEKVVVVEADTGRLLGTEDGGRAPATVHPGAVHLHQGESYVVDTLDLPGGLAFVHAGDPGYRTFARQVTDIRIAGYGECRDHGPVTLGLVPVEVSRTVVGYLRRRLDGEVLDFVDLDMPTRTLATEAVMWSVTPEALAAHGVPPERAAGALHAAEHAAIGLLPLVVSCDRGDVGGLSTTAGPRSGLPTVFVYDGHPGGAGFVARGFADAARWLGATADAIAACECPAGCPSCVQSSSCGSGNDPLDKAGAVAVLRLVCAATAGRSPRG